MSLLTFKGRINRDRTLTIRPFLFVKIINWAEVSFLAGKRGYFLVEPTYTKKSITSVYILKYKIVHS